MGDLKQTIKQEYRSFLDTTFKGLEIRTPLFYNWPFSLRFDLQTGKTDTDEYFIEVVRRATALFKAAFSNDEALFLVLTDYKYKRRKIRFSNYIFKQIQNLIKEEVTYIRPAFLYKTDEQNGKKIIAIVKIEAERLNYQNVLSAIANTDFPPRQPRLDGKSILSVKEIHLINTTRRLVFHMYDDRGLDIVAPDLETLKPFYIKYNDWILDYDRKEIDKQFDKTI
ncbi:DUF3885 domain-containing protein [Hymenobacter cavernae]|uniref:DUF3885 domain-containing protein n=1 Tax=Hymenobacter cavernae TaxID=2044852 RepID=A0ABQ1U4B5_9BACT|nr:DUF3885 domain-containing protein [Hymenobacter cavernae]GGF10043.1 hypothetical protein GCM10011383_21550 [Hymenobacter cavernae]